MVRNARTNKNFVTDYHLDALYSTGRTHSEGFEYYDKCLCVYTYTYTMHFKIKYHSRKVPITKPVRNPDNGLVLLLHTKQSLTVIAGDSSECAGSPELCVANRPGFGLSALKPKQI